MRKAAIVFLLHFLLSVSVFGTGFQDSAPASQVQLDSAAVKALESKLSQYVKAIAPLDCETQQEECDFLISSCNDSLTRQHVALWLYRHYISSQIMGVEAVAIHLTDKWFSTGAVKMSSDIELMNAKIYAEFNMRSLVGMRAPGLTLKARDGSEHRVFGGNASEGDRWMNSSRYSVLYFYDTGCPNCLAQTVMLRNLLPGAAVPIDFYAIYTGADSLAWDGYVDKHFSIKSDQISLSHLWDPQLDSDFQRKYGVLQTPRMFLVDRDWKIIGRGLDAQTLVAMLADLADEGDYQYGSEKSDGFLKAIFSTLPEDFTVRDVNSLTDRMALRSGNDSGTYRHIMGDLLYYLSYQRDGRYKEGCKYLIDNYILPDSKIWSTGSDSLAVLSFASAMDEILSKAAVGTRLPRLKVKGKLVSGSVPENLSGGIKSEKFNLRSLPDGSYVMFFSRDCPDCQDNLAAADSLLRSSPEMKLLLVDMTDVYPSGGKNWQDRLFETLDLSSLPLILHLDRRGVVSGRYLDFR